MSNQYKIAIIDDDDIYRYTILKTIESLQVSKSTMSFTNGREALNYILKHIEEPDTLPDIILLDVNMPIMDGFEFMEEYEKFSTEIKNATRVFMISSSIHTTDIERAKQNPEISDYITKPINSIKLQRILQKPETTDES